MMGDRFETEDSLDPGRAHSLRADRLTRTGRAIEARLCWPISHPSGFDSRPAALASALSQQGVLAFSATEYHGRLDARSDFERRAYQSLVWRSRSSTRAAVLSPLFLASEVENSMWIDLYDDWSRAPEMRKPIRQLARFGYRRLRARRASSPVTVNSIYMRDKFAMIDPLIVSNGVDPLLADSRHAILDDIRRVVLVGNFFEGRTDWRALARIFRSPADEILVFGSNSEIANLAGEANRERGRPVVRCLPKTPMIEIAKHVGTRTVFAVPHLVSDYTMSQDIMKAYQAIALGCRVVVPMELLPPAIPVDHALTYGLGADVGSVIAASFRLPAITEADRLAFTAENSWDQRASVIARFLHAG